MWWGARQSTAYASAVHAQVRGQGSPPAQGGPGRGSSRVPTGVRLAKFLATLSSRYGQPDSRASRKGDQGATGSRWPAARPAGQWSRLAKEPGRCGRSARQGRQPAQRKGCPAGDVAEVTTDSHDQNKCLRLRLSCASFIQPGGNCMAEATKGTDAL